MKKLMIAAAAAAMVGGAFADAVPVNPNKVAALYNIKYTLKTLVPKSYSCGKADCTICDKTEKDTGYYYENGTYKIEGVLAFCSLCDVVSTNYATARLALWDASNKADLYVHPDWLDASTVTDVDAEGAAVSNIFTRTDQVVYGKSSTKVAMDTAIQVVKPYNVKLVNSSKMGVTTVNCLFDLRASGLGTYAWLKGAGGFKGYDSKLNPTFNDAGYVKSVSGNVAGSIPAFTGYVKATTTSDAYYYGAYVVDNLCGSAAEYCGVLAAAGNYTLPITDGFNFREGEAGQVKGEDKFYAVPAYGTWTMKYNASATKKDLYKSIPSWMPGRKK